MMDMLYNINRQTNDIQWAANNVKTQWNVALGVDMAAGDRYANMDISAHHRGRRDK